MLRRTVFFPVLSVGCFLALNFIMMAPAADAAPEVAAYGTWQSPVSPAMVAAAGGGISDIAVDGGKVYFVEERAAEGGRNAIVALANGKAQDITPKTFDARTKVQEYGGGNLLVAGGVVYFPNYADQRLYRQGAGGPPVAITPPPVKEGALRFADCTMDAARQRLICIEEDHSGEGPAKNRLVAVAVDGKSAPSTLFEGTDFVAAPRLDPTGAKLAWISWNNPNMPWDKTTLWTANIGKDGNLTGKKAVAGGAAIGEPQWSTDGQLYFVSDQTGFWNIYRFDGKATKAVHPMKADFSEPAWLLNFSSYAIVNPGTIVAAVTRNARTSLMKIDIASGKAVALNAPFVEVHYLRRLNDHSVVFTGFEGDRPARLVQLDVTSGQITTLRGATSLAVPAAYISKARDITFAPAPGELSHAFYYPPQNPDYRAPRGEKPPLIVMAHGGPTGNATPALSMAIQFWTSRGFAFLDVNYRGSSGFGRAYRDKLKGQWGVVDIADVVKGAQYVAHEGLADPARLIVRGGSAGGYVVLASLAFHDVFAVGASYYGISDLSVLAQHTHKFEARYMDGLVGPYPAAKDIYMARSPIYHLDGFKKPLILFQGLIDEVVPPGQSAAIYKALKAKGIEVEYYTYPKEGHGFRISADIIDALQKELAFYHKVLAIK